MTFPLSRRALLALGIATMATGPVWAQMADEIIEPVEVWNLYQAFTNPSEIHVCHRVFLVPTVILMVRNECTASNYIP